MRRRLLGTAMVLLACSACLAQKPAGVGEAEPAVEGQAEVLDRVAAIVGDSVILQSDVEEEMRFAAFEPFSAPEGENSRQAAMQRLIDRDLIQQQRMLQQNAAAVTEQEVQKQLMQLRKSLPACAGYDCPSDAGWAKFCAAHGFTPEQVEARWRLRMTLLAFIEQRFRTGIRISQPEIQDYYAKQFVPRFDEKQLKAPPLSEVSARIQEILLQQRVNVLLDQWLSSLREQGDVQVLDRRDAPPQAKDTNTDTPISPLAPASAPTAPTATPANGDGASH